jgi:hypothetical protein
MSDRPSTGHDRCVSIAAVSAAERRLGITFPPRLRDVYAEGDGRFRADGQWWVVWPLERLIGDNEAAWRDRRLPSSFLAFGDDGTGNPFCVGLKGAHDEVLRWSWIDNDVVASAGSMAEFLDEWVIVTRYPCPCCGYLTHTAGPGDFEFCDICGWQDDLSQLRFAAMAGGANRASLIEAQMAYLSSAGTMPTPHAERDPAWRPIDLGLDEVESPEPGKDYGLTYADDPTTYYYWRRTAT